MSNVDHATTRDDVFSWLHNMQHDDNPEYLAEAADLVLAAYDALQAERDEAWKMLAASEARCGRYRIALESEFAYNMLAIVQQYADPKRTTNAAEAALAAWQELRRHNDPISLWPGYQPGDLPEGEVTT